MKRDNWNLDGKLDDRSKTACSLLALEIWNEKDKKLDHGMNIPQFEYWKWYYFLVKCLKEQQCIVRLEGG